MTFAFFEQYSATDITEVDQQEVQQLNKNKENRNECKSCW
jgi:hypothetical protein